MKVLSMALAIGWCVLLMCASSWAQVSVRYGQELGSVFYARVDGENDGRQVFRLELDGAGRVRGEVDGGVGAREVFYASEGRVSRLEPAPAGGRLALTETFFEENAPEGRANYVVRRMVAGTEVMDRYYENSRLIILDADGRRVGDPIDAVRDYAWSPAGDKVVYVTGDYYEGGVGFLSTGTWILDVSSGSTKKIHESGWGVTWAEWDRRIYTLELSGQPARVLRHRADGGDVGEPETTSHQGMFFSPSGRYYFDPARDGEPTRIFETSGDRDATMDHEFLAFGDARYLRPRRWLDDHILLIPYPTDQRRDMLYSLENKGALLVEGRVLGRLESEGRPDTLLVLGLEGVIVETRIDEIR